MENENLSFDTKWTVWYHYDIQQWTSSSFRKLYTIQTISDFWQLVDIFKENPTLLMEHIYVMRGDITPIWEDSRNRKGGCWSIKIDLRDSFTIFVKILACVLGETSMIGPNDVNLSNHVTGVSFCSKNSFNAIIQIWNDDKALSKVSYLQPAISEPFMAEIIYRPHIPEY